MKTVWLALLFSFSATAAESEVTYNPKYKPTRQIASKQVKAKAGGITEKCMNLSHGFAKASFAEMLGPQKRSVSHTEWVTMMVNPNQKTEPGAPQIDKEDKPEDKTRLVVEVGVRSSSFNSKNKDFPFDYAVFVMMDSKCSMVDTAKFFDAKSRELELFDMTEM